MIQPGILLRDRYLVIKRLGKGGFAEIWEVDDFGKPKVLKVLLKNSHKRLSLFQQEAEVLKLLRHPGIPRVQPDGDFIWLDEANKRWHCFVMDKIDGSNLEEWLNNSNNPPITLKQAINWLKQLVEIIDHIHQQQYIHRDIKPSNIILKPDGQLALIDFGAARGVSDTYLVKIACRCAGTVVGTSGYMPPEQVCGFVLPQSDFYALGCTFIYLLKGKPSSISPMFTDLLDWLMAPDPGKRPLNAQQILQRLAEIETDQLSVVSPTDLQAIVPPKTITWWLKQLTQTWKALIGLAIAAIATVTVLNLPKFTSPQSKSPVPLAKIFPVKTLSSNSEVLDAVTSVAFSPNGQTLVKGSFDTTIKLLNWRTGKVLKTLSKASSQVWAVAVSPDGRLFASGHLEDKTIKLWDLNTGKLRGILRGHSDQVRSVTFSPDGQTLASGSHDKTIKLWRVSTGEILHTFAGHTNHVTSVAFSPDGKTLATASDDKTIKLWNLDTMKLVRPLKGHSGQVLSVAFSPDGQTLVSGSGENRDSGSVDNTIKLWNPNNGELRSTLTGHTSWVWCLAISPDGQTLASGSYDNSIRLWNLRTGELLSTLSGHSNRVYSVAFSPSGQTLASGSDDQSVKIWPVSIEKNGKLKKFNLPF